MIGGQKKIENTLKEVSFRGKSNSVLFRVVIRKAVL